MKGAAGFNQDFWQMATIKITQRSKAIKMAIVTLPENLQFVLLQTAITVLKSHAGSIRKGYETLKHDKKETYNQSSHNIISSELDDQNRVPTHGTINPSITRH